MQGKVRCLYQQTGYSMCYESELGERKITTRFKHYAKCVNRTHDLNQIKQGSLYGSNRPLSMLSDIAIIIVRYLYFLIFLY